MGRASGRWSRFRDGDPARPGGFLLAAVFCAAASGAVGTLAVGRRVMTARRGSKKENRLAAGLKAGLLQGFVGGGVAAFSIRALMAAAISGFPLDNSTDPSALMRPQVFVGGFFVALSVFLYVLAGGLLLGPALGVFIGRISRSDVSRPEVPP